MQWFIYIAIALGTAALGIHAVQAQTGKAQTVAAPQTVYIVAGKQDQTKRDAVVALLSNPQAVVYECKSKELTDKLTLRNR